MVHENPEEKNSISNILKLLKLSDEALHQYDQKYRLMAENSYDIISLHRLEDLNFIYVNPTVRRVMGYDPGEMIGQNPLIFIHPEDIQLIWDTIEQAKEVGEALVQYRCRKENGAYIWLESSGKIIQDEAGTQAFLINSRDVSERKDYEKQIKYRLSLEEAVAKAARLFFSPGAPPLTEILGILGKAVYANRAYIFEYDNNKTSLSNTHEWCDIGTAPQQEHLQHIPDALCPWWMEKLHKGDNVVIPDLSKLPPEAAAEKDLLESQDICSLAVVPIFLGNSRLLGFMGFDDTEKCRAWHSEDIATLRVVAEMIGLYCERRNMERALMDSERRMASIIDFLPDATFVIDKRGTVITWNRAMEEMTGIKAADILGKGNYEYSLPFYGQRRPILIDLVLNPENKAQTSYLSLEERDGTLVSEIFNPKIGAKGAFLSGTASAIYDAQGNKAGAIESLRDITERWQAEEKIKFLSFHDKLTGLYNRAFFEEEIRRLDTERNLPLSIIIGDVNGLKFVNDTFGHQKGDRLLLNVARLLTQACRQGDVIARWGGDEFAVLLPGTNRAIAQIICDRIRETCQQSEPDPIKISIALGVGSKENPREDISKILQSTDEMMYTTKLRESKCKRDSFIEFFEQTFWKGKYEDEQHSSRMRELAVKTSPAFGLSDDQLDALALLCTLHDIGKISVPLSLLNKPQALSENEWEVVKKHSETGYRIAQSTPEITSIADAVLAHHERWDGTGYPLGLKGKEIPLITRIFAIIDAYDVMTHEAPYKRAVSAAEARMEIKRCAGTQFDPDLVAKFLHLMASEGII